MEFDLSKYDITEVIVQAIIMFTGIIAIYLTQQEKRKDWKKYACIFGLISQPFFLYTTYVNNQLGMFVLSIMYTYVWCIGFKNNWLMTNGKY